MYKKSFCNGLTYIDDLLGINVFFSRICFIVMDVNLSRDGNASNKT